MGALAELRAWRQRYDADRRQRGRDGGELAVCVRLFERKLRRALTDAARDTLRARLAAQHEALGDVVANPDASALEEWLVA
jgi:hypothetical protein